MMIFFYHHHFDLDLLAYYPQFYLIPSIIIQTVYSHNHNYEGEVLPYDNTFQFNKVTIEKNVWIGMNVVILPGSYIGEGAIIGAGSVVYANVPKLAIVGSAGYKILKYRDPDHYNELELNKKYGGIDGRPINS